MVWVTWKYFSPGWEILALVPPGFQDTRRSRWLMKRTKGGPDKTKKKKKLKSQKAKTPTRKWTKKSPGRREEKKDKAKIRLGKDYPLRIDKFQRFPSWLLQLEIASRGEKKNPKKEKKKWWSHSFFSAAPSGCLFVCLAMKTKASLDAHLHQRSGLISNLGECGKLFLCSPILELFFFLVVIKKKKEHYSKLKISYVVSKCILYSLHRQQKGDWMAKTDPSTIQSNPGSNLQRAGDVYKHQQTFNRW